VSLQGGSASEIEWFVEEDELFLRERILADELRGISGLESIPGSVQNRCLGRVIQVRVFRHCRETSAMSVAWVSEQKLLFSTLFDSFTL